MKIIFIIKSLPMSERANHCVTLGRDNTQQEISLHTRLKVTFVNLIFTHSVSRVIFLPALYLSLC